MKFLHLSDLHLGKKVNKFDLIEDQRYVLAQIMDIANEVDAVVIAGDVYDKTLPPVEAVELFDWFLSGLADKQIPIMIISGNHDSGERLAFGRNIMKNDNIYISSVYNGTVDKVSVKGVDFYLLPFIKPASVRRFFDEEFDNYTDMMAAVLRNINPKNKSVLAAHQFVTTNKCDTKRCESETISVGGLDNVEVSVFDKFDYVALGHIHGSQCVGRETVRYCGSPLKYSFSETNHKKYVVIVDTDNGIELRELKFLHDMREVKGRLADIINGGKSEDYMHVTLTDEEEIMDPIGKIRRIYPNTMLLDFENSRTRIDGFADKAEDVENKTPYELFCEFFQKQNGTEMTEEMQEIVRELLEVDYEA